MAISDPTARLRQAVAEAAEALSRQSARAADEPRAPAPGDLCLLGSSAENALEWLVVRAHPDDPNILLAVPTDDFPLVGTPDVPLPADVAGRLLIARCGAAIWLPTAAFLPQSRLGVIPEETLRLVRRAMADLARGRSEGDATQRQADVDPEYEVWMARVEQAGEQLQSRADRPPVALGTVLTFERLATETPAELRSQRPQALAAEPGGSLVSALNDALDAGEVRYYELVLRTGGKLILLADGHGVRGIWAAQAGEAPPRLAAVGPTDDLTVAEWKLGPNGRLHRAEPLFRWVDGQIVLEIGSGDPEVLTIQR